MKQPITIKQGSFVAHIYDVVNLMELPVANVRKLWRIMFYAMWEPENRETITLIREWLPRFINEKKDNARRLENELVAARHDAEEKRRKVTALGSALDDWIAHEKEKLAYAKRADKQGRLKGTLATYQARYEDAIRPKTDHQKAVKEVKHVERALISAKRSLEKAEKLQTIFNEMAAKARI